MQRAACTGFSIFISNEGVPIARERAGMPARRREPR